MPSLLMYYLLLRSRRPYLLLAAEDVLEEVDVGAVLNRQECLAIHGEEAVQLVLAPERGLQLAHVQLLGLVAFYHSIEED